MKRTKSFKTTLISASIAGAVLFTAGCGDNSNSQNEPGSPENNNNNGQTEEYADDYPQLDEEVAADEEEAVIRTNRGDIHIKLFPEAAPKAVENFMTLGEQGYYEGVIFHRVIEDFMIQGGDPTGTGMGGESAFGEPFEDEFDESVVHFRGALSMANSGPNTNGSQFFIVHAGPDRLTEEMFEGSGISEEKVNLYLEYGGTPHLDGGHTVFGHVIDGMDIVDEIASVDTDAGDKPEDDIVIEEVEIIN